MKKFSTVSEYEVISAAYSYYLQLWSREVDLIRENPDSDCAREMRHYYWGICEELHEELLILDKEMGKMVDLSDLM